MKTIPLTQGKVAIVDDADYDWLNQRKWCAHQERHTYYAVRSTTGCRSNRKEERMHRLILGLQRGDKQQCDHIDGNGLNNQRSNLRNCTVTQNSQSQRKKWKPTTSRYKGIYWNRRDLKWQARIRTNGKRIHLGYFSSEITAARSYNDAALKYFGEFALLNRL